MNETLPGYWMADFRAMAGRKLLNAVEIKCLKEQLEL